MLSLSRAAPVRLASPPQLPLHMTRRPCSPDLALYLTLHLFMRLSGSGGGVSQRGRCDSELASAFFHLRQDLSSV